MAGYAVLICSESEVATNKKAHAPLHVSLVFDGHSAS
jgi:hypothetical protein